MPNAGVRGDRPYPTTYYAVRRIFKELDQRDSNQTYIVTVPGRGYQLVGLHPPSPEQQAETEASRGFAIPGRPSIAVLPFQNLGGDPEQEYFADGIVEDIITGLSRIRWLMVIVRNSSFVYKGNAVDVKQVGRELGVSYVLQGGVRKAGKRVRVTARLIDAQTGAHLWAERYDQALGDVFALQDEIAISVIGAIEPSVRKAEIDRVRRKRPKVSRLTISRYKRCPSFTI